MNPSCDWESMASLSIPDHIQLFFVWYDSFFALHVCATLDLLHFGRRFEAPPAVMSWTSVRLRIGGISYRTGDANAGIAGLTVPWLARCRGGETFFTTYPFTFNDRTGDERRTNGDAGEPCTPLSLTGDLATTGSDTDRARGTDIFKEDPNASDRPSLRTRFLVQEKTTIPRTNSKFETESVLSRTVSATVHLDQSIPFLDNL